MKKSVTFREAVMAMTPVQSQHILGALKAAFNATLPKEKRLPSLCSMTKMELTAIVLDAAIREKEKVSA